APATVPPAGTSLPAWTDEMDDYVPTNRGMLSRGQAAATGMAAVVSGAAAARGGRARGGDGLGESERFGEAAIRLEMIAVLAVPGRVLRAGEQQTLAIGRPALQVILDQAESELLVVRIVAGLRRRGRQRLHQQRAI